MGISNLLRVYTCKCHSHDSLYLTYYENGKRTGIDGWQMVGTEPECLIDLTYMYQLATNSLPATQLGNLIHRFVILQQQPPPWQTMRDTSKQSLYSPTLSTLLLDELLLPSIQLNGLTTICMYNNSESAWTQLWPKKRAQILQGRDFLPPLLSLGTMVNKRCWLIIWWLDTSVHELIILFCT